MEIINSISRNRIPRFALFDFDGTVSLIREGWQNIMIPMMVETIVATKTNETKAQITDIVSKFVQELTGRQTIYQMIRLEEEVRKRGGYPENPLDYKKLFLQRLDKHIATRLTGLQRGMITPDKLLVPGCLQLLEALRSLGLTLYLASGTDLKDVQREAVLLKIKKYFSGHIYGALDNYQDFSKEMIVRKMLEDNSITGKELIGFGDGFVETQCVKRAGGFVVGVASNEAKPDGIVDQQKRQTLINSGADIIIPDYTNTGPLLNYIFR